MYGLTLPMNEQVELEGVARDLREQKVANARVIGGPDRLGTPEFNNQQRVLHWIGHSHVNIIVTTLAGAANNSITEAHWVLDNPASMNIWSGCFIFEQLIGSKESLADWAVMRVKMNDLFRARNLRIFPRVFTDFGDLAYQAYGCVENHLNWMAGTDFRVLI